MKLLGILGLSLLLSSLCGCSTTSLKVIRDPQGRIIEIKGSGTQETSIKTDIEEVKYDNKADPLFNLDINANKMGL